MAKQYISFYRFDDDGSDKLGYEVYKHVMIEKKDFDAACDQLGYSKSEDIVFCHECKHYHRDEFKTATLITCDLLSIDGVHDHDFCSWGELKDDGNGAGR